MKLRGWTDADIPAPDLVYFPGRLTSDAGPEWHSDRVSSWVHNINGDRSGGERCTLASWDPEDFESDFDRLCDSTVAVCAIEDGQRRRSPLRDLD